MNGTESVGNWKKERQFMPMASFVEMPADENGFEFVLCKIIKTEFENNNGENILKIYFEKNYQVVVAEICKVNEEAKNLIFDDNGVKCKIRFENGKTNNICRLIFSQNDEQSIEFNGGKVYFEGEPQNACAF